MESSESPKSELPKQEVGYENKELQQKATELEIADLRTQPDYLLRRH